MTGIRQHSRFQLAYSELQRTTHPVTAATLKATSRDHSQLFGGQSFIPAHASK